jgi:3-dehydroquinate synthase
MSNPPSLRQLSQQVFHELNGTESLRQALKTLSLWFSNGWSRAQPLSLRSTDADAYLSLWSALIYKRGLTNLSWDGKSIGTGSGSSKNSNAHKFIPSLEFATSADLFAEMTTAASTSGTIIIMDTGFANCWPSYSNWAQKQHFVILFTPSESSKNLATIAKWSSFIDQQTKRIWSIGGGITTDLAGFLAGLFELEHLSSPTTLLSAFDASIGGKTGANFHPYGKNQVGLFYPISRWVVVTEHFNTLPKNEVLCGLAEAIKHVWLAEENPRDTLEQIGSLIRATGKEQFISSQDQVTGILKLVAFNHTVKSCVVSADPLEHGIRKSLNMGHTLGHILEGLAEDGWIKPIPHGLAIAVGMLFLLRSGIALDDTNRFATLIEELLSAAEVRLPITLERQIRSPNDPDQTDLLAAFSRLAKSDKKADLAEPSLVPFVVPRRGILAPLLRTVCSESDDLLQHSTNLPLVRISVEETLRLCAIGGIFRADFQ